MADLICPVVQLAVGFCFGIAALAKVTAFRLFVEGVDSYRMVPRMFLGPFGGAVVVVEAIVAACFLRTAVVVGAVVSGVFGVKRARADSNHGGVPWCCDLAWSHSDTCKDEECAAVLSWSCPTAADTTGHLHMVECFECYRVEGAANCLDNLNDIKCSWAVLGRELPSPRPPPIEENKGCGGDDATVGVSVNVGVGDDANDGGESAGIPWWPTPGDDPCDPVQPAASPSVGN